MSTGRFERWRVSIPAGISRGTSPDEWHDAVVLVERGTLEVVCRGGASARFGTGSLLALGWLPVDALGSVGPREVRLLAVRRRGAGPSIWWMDVPVSRWSMALAALSRGGPPAARAGDDGSGADR
jgi:hypothetical protein